MDEGNILIVNFTPHSCQSASTTKALIMNFDILDKETFCNITKKKSI